jgi:hypothetical protein
MAWLVHRHAAALAPAIRKQDRRTNETSYAYDPACLRCHDRMTGGSMTYIDMLYRLAIGLWTGGNAIFTLVLTPILFRTEQRDTAARIVGNLFPAYFRWGLICGLIALTCRIISRSPSSCSRLQLIVLLLMLVAVSFQAVYVEPRAAELKRQIGSFETTDTTHPLRKEFSRLHGISASCNLGVLAGGVLMLVLP